MMPSTSFAEELAQRWCLIGCLCKRHESVGVPKSNQQLALGCSIILCGLIAKPSIPFRLLETFTHQPLNRKR
jgi:hypothetical protein